MYTVWCDYNESSIVIGTYDRQEAIRVCRKLTEMNRNSGRKYYVG